MAWELDNLTNPFGYKKGAQKPVNNMSGLLGRLTDKVKQQYQQGLLNQVINDHASIGREIGQLFDPQYMSQVKPMTQEQAISTALDINPVLTFIGKGSKLWNSDLAKKAVELEKKGVSPENIWRQTGTLRGVDGKLRQEISDDAVKSVLAKPNSLGTFSLDDIIAGSKSFDAYPQLKNINVTKGNETYFSPSENIISSANFKNEQVLGSPFQNQENRIYKIAEILDAQGKTTPKTEARLESMLEKINKNASKKFEGILDKTEFSPQSILHEQQHAIQELEGWAKGGSSKKFIKDFVEKKSQSNQSINELNAQMKNIVSTMDSVKANRFLDPLFNKKISELETQYNDLINQRNKLVKNAQIDPREEAFKQYQRLAGEAESRLTERRMKLTPQERLQYFPYTEGQYGLDVPLNELIVRGLLK